MSLFVQKQIRWKLIFMLVAPEVCLWLLISLITGTKQFSIKYSAVMVVPFSLQSIWTRPVVLKNIENMFFELKTVSSSGEFTFSDQAGVR